MVWDDHRAWIERGCQRRALLEALTKPKTPTQLCRGARIRAPCIQVRDVWLLLGQYMQQGLVDCLTPNEPIGKIFYLSSLGQRVACAMLAREVVTTPTDVDWCRYSRVVRAKARRVVVIELARPQGMGPRGRTASMLRDQLRDTAKLGLNSVIRALNDLVSMRLVRCIAITPKRKQKVYGLTRSGRLIAEWLRRT